jgi:hypothetical protein
MKLRHSQQGVTAIGWVLIFMLVGLVGLAGIRLFPVYMQSMAVNSMMQSITTDPEVTEPAQIRRGLIRNMRVSNITAVELDAFELKNIDGRRHLYVEYDHRVPFIGGVDFIVTFEKAYEFRSQ